MKKIFILLILFSLQALAQFDPDNAYQWNRKNELSANGKTDTKEWYEWWYYKVVDPNTNEAFFFVYGIINPWDTSNKLKGTRAFISFGDYQDFKFIENRFSVSEFQSAYDDVLVKIDDNQASDQRIIGKLQNSKSGTISWDLNITKQWRFNAMGWGTHAEGFSGIYWYPAQASALMTGWINVNGKVYRLLDAPAYQDRNWGRSFPQWWTWLVANNFKDNPNTYFAAGGGRPKVFDKKFIFNGLCIGLHHLGKDYIFRTTDADIVKMNIRWGKWEIMAKNKHGYKIEISAHAPPEKFMLLPFQTPHGEIFYDYEALQGNMKIRLSKWKLKTLRYEPILELETEQAGIEWGTPHKLDLAQFFKQSHQIQ